MFNDKVLLVTGGTGSFGHMFTKMTLERYRPKKLIIFSRDEEAVGNGKKICKQSLCTILYWRCS